MQERGDYELVNTRYRSKILGSLCKGPMLLSCLQNTALLFDTKEMIAINVCLDQNCDVTKRVGSKTTRATPSVGHLSTINPGERALIQIKGRMTALVTGLAWSDIRFWLEEDLEVGTAGLEFHGLLGVDDPLFMRSVFSIASNCDEGDYLRRWIAIHLYKHYSTARRIQRDPVTPRLSPSRLKRVKDLIASNLRAHLPLERLASEAAMSPFHFAREFKKCTGFSPHRYVMRQRTDRAISLLSQSKNRIADVAAESGFVDSPHLARQLLKRLGCTPSDLRHVLDRAIQI